MSEDNDFFKNAKHIKEDDDYSGEEDNVHKEFKEYYNLEGDNESTSKGDNNESTSEAEEESHNHNQNFSSNIFGSFDYNQFMNQSSSEYMMYNTMDIIKTMNIMTELRQLFSSLGDWDRIVLFYAYELMQRNMQISYKLILHLFKTQNDELISQMIYWGLLLFCLSNVQTAYSYLIYRIYKLDKAFARKLHQFLKEQFMFFENTNDMSGTFNNNVYNRLDHNQGSRGGIYGNNENVS